VTTGSDSSQPAAELVEDTQERTSNNAVQNALRFYQSLRADPLGTSYNEIAGPPEDSEHRPYTQSNYLLKITLKEVGQQGLAEAINVDPTQPNDDPKNAGKLTGYRWCILEGRTDIFYLKGITDSDYNDVLALLVLYWLTQAKGLLAFRARRKAKNCYNKLKARFDTARGVIEMDPAERENGLYSVYKIALLGIAAKAMKDTVTINQIRNKLTEWQEQDSGGWRTDRQTDSQPHGFANLETSCCCTLAIL
jgi:hypothetical protein